ncbi:ABC transporter substrate-binding protein [Candidatus Pelagadaptatus aseana]|uniref:ABC transporter substrate-binding protein n=1 Tax=Candidatus Pelagadaptatus aseana TaxID=3120508 RepID=UPI003C6F54F5
MLQHLGLALLLICAAAFAGAQEQNGPVVLQLKWLHQFQFAGYYAALEKGYYREAGLDVVIEERTQGLTPVDSLISGRAHFAVSDSGVLIYRANGVPLVALGAIFQHSPSVLLARKDAGIETLQDLKGKRVRLVTGYMNAELVSMMENGGVKIYEVELMPGLLGVDKIIEGELDAINAYITNEPRTLKRYNVPYTIFHPRDFGVNFYGDILVTTDGLIETRPELVQKFREASFKGWQYAINHPDEIVDIILLKYNSQNKSREDLMFEARELIKLMLADVVPVGYMNQSRWNQIAEVFRDQGKLQANVDLSRFIYQEQSDSGLTSFLLQYRGPLVFSLFLLLALAMVFHIFHLRSEVRLRTRDLEEAKDRAEQEARTDVLTNLPNRRHFMKVLERDISQADRSGSNLVVMVADIDFFKDVNDQYTHAAGDEALRIISLCLTESIRNGDEVARLGGEEFAVTCPNTTIAEAAMLAERLRNKVEQQVVVYDQHSFSLTISLGLAQLETGQTASELLHEADLALYEAKSMGRNCVRIYEAGTSSYKTKLRESASITPINRGQ